MSEHVHDHNCQPKTAIEAALVILNNGIEAGVNELSTIKFWQFKKKYLLRGALIGLTTAVSMLVQLERHFNNDDGSMN